MPAFSSANAKGAVTVAVIPLPGPTAAAHHGVSLLRSEGLCLTLIDTDCHRYLWPMGPESTWQRELAIAQVFYRDHAGIEIVTAVGR
jgi:hypothetical protein